MLRNHMLLMFVYAVCTATFFSLLWKPTRREQIKFFALVFCALFLGGIFFAWIMYPFPLR